MSFNNIHRNHTNRIFYRNPKSINQYLCPTGCICHKLFCIFGDFYASWMQDAEIKKKVQSDIFFELCNVRLEQWKVAFCTGQNSCWYCAMWGWYSQNWLGDGTKMMFVVIQYKAGPIKSKIKVKTMGNLWIIV